MLKCRRQTKMSFLFMENRKRLPKSVRKFIRMQKAQIRRQFLDVKKQEELIKELYNKVK
jgi:hypothetical protein